MRYPKQNGQDMCAHVCKTACRDEEVCVKFAVVRCVRVVPALLFGLNDFVQAQCWERQLSVGVLWLHVLFACA